jgi:S1-C subfamily serine protease
MKGFLNTARNHRVFFLLALVALAVSAAGCAALPSASHGVAGRDTASSFVVADHDIASEMLREAKGLIQSGRTTQAATLIQQLDRKQCALDLPKPSHRAMTPSEIYQKRRASVLLVSAVKKGGKPGEYQQSIAAGFVLTESGAIVTNYHVVNQADAEALVIGTADGHYYAVKEVLAADQKNDVAILRTDGAGLTPAFLAPDTPVGSPVTVISHPDYHFYVLTQGVVSRYFSAHRAQTPSMAVTADFAKGSSGAPIFNQYGGVAGMVESTTSVYYNTDRGEPRNLQMVFKSCVTARAIAALVSDAAGAGPGAPRN